VVVVISGPELNRGSL